MLDRLAVLTPAWTETHAADLGIALVEVLAYAADHLSYQQDAVSTEAYLDTARSRISLRRHARLVDYPIGEGCNARTLVAVTTTADRLTVPAGTLFYVRRSRPAAGRSAGDPVAQQLRPGTAARLHQHAGRRRCTPRSTASTSTPGATADCCLPAGATEATLAGNAPTAPAGQHADLRGGQRAADRRARGRRPRAPLRRAAHQRHRHRLPGPAAHRPAAPGTASRITRITWSAADALPFPLCISSTTDAEHGSPPIPVSASRAATSCPPIMASGTAAENLGTGPRGPARAGPAASCSCGTATQAGAAPLLPRYYPGLAQSPLTFSVPFERHRASAAAFLAPDSAARGRGHHPDRATTAPPGSRSRTCCPAAAADHVLRARRSSTTDRSSCASATTSTAWPPSTGMSFTATYRVGNGSAGNMAGTRSRTPSCRRRSCRRRATSAGCATRSPQPAAPTPRTCSTSASSRRSPTDSSSGASPRPTTGDGRAVHRRPRGPRHLALDRQLVHRVRVDRAGGGADPAAHRRHNHAAEHAADDGHRHRGRGARSSSACGSSWRSASTRRISRATCTRR